MSRPSDYDDGTGAGGTLRAESPELGFAGWLRWFWRQLTSMRVALILLLLLAVAAIPGSLVPQRGADPNGVVQYQKDHPDLFPILDAFPIQAFDVYGSVWFSAIYLLLFISLIGCVLPRIAHHWKAWRGRPPKTPARLQRMAGFSEIRLSNPDATPAEREAFAARAVDEAAAILKKLRYRVEVQRASRRGVDEVSVSAERGYLRETGNLLFHVSLLGVLVSVGLGGVFTFNGQKVLIEGETMVNQLIDYDTATSGRSFDSSSLEPFSLRLDTLDVTYNTPDDGNVQAIGLVKDYTANMTLISPEGDESEHVIRVNHPLRVHGSPIYLIANGYAPKITIRNAEGTVVYSEAMPFIPQDNLNMTSLGVVKVPDGIVDESGEPVQLGLRGFFYPTKADLDTGAYTSNYPDLENPVLTLDVFVGDLGINDGIPKSVYALDTSDMEQVTGRAVDLDSIELRPGEQTELPNGFGTIEFESVPRYASFDVMQNPAQEWILVFAVLALGGLMWSLFVPRRRMWVKALPSEDGVVLQYAALARGDDPALERAVEELRDRHRELL
ncbi:cytochrome c biogenesis protein ResB [Micrococcus luteus]|uniref:cytochrome c biogenesis protein ResB n=1 Tax=Micrococcus luteus TaxID=1270 RepID=UPI0010C7E7AE|nr:cytochrome c biogenesis protein ResB [Micrococcus luteus]MBN6750985.1 cytochrome c biogenesis protein ResB [Micrococcus luteus]MBN6760991.1 cytochrome c biogenesis protein ResB [Micrococcus luteus]MBN6802499.1 cytochrome c biogenesis protein ResB [Micrococcus luteus]QCP08775.1 cytochrome c biogenesis protein ResB [Micrococcus luteus]